MKKLRDFLGTDLRKIAIELKKLSPNQSSGGSGYSGFSGFSGSGISGYSGFSGYSGPGIASLKLAENIPLRQIAGTIVSKAGTVTGAVGVGSSLFLQRITIPAAMAITEINMALSIGFPATNQGAGTMSRSFVLYSLGNSTSLASVLSASGTSAWSTGTSTTAGAVSLTQFQGGWSSPLIQPMTFASTSVAPGEYVVGQLFNFAQGSSTWTLNLYGGQVASTILASAATNLTSATLSAASTFATGSSTLTAFTVAPSVGSAFSTGGIVAVTGITSLINTGATNATVFGMTHASTAVSSYASASSTGVTAATWVAIPFITGTTAGSILSASALINAISNAGTGGFALAGSMTTNSVGAVTNVALGALSSSTLAQLTLPNFGFIGTGSTTSGFPTHFMVGIMSTGGIPVAITLTSNAVTYSGSAAFQQPWFALCGT